MLLQAGPDTGPGPGSALGPGAGSAAPLLDRPRCFCAHCCVVAALLLDKTPISGDSSDFVDYIADPGQRRLSTEQF